MIPTARPGLIRAIVLTGLLAGTLDALAASIQFMLRFGRHPKIVFQYVASGLLGRAAFTSGDGTALLGLLLHYFNVFCFTVVLFLLYPFCYQLVKLRLFIGVIYGLVAWSVMNLVVVPLSRVSPGKPAGWHMLAEMFILIVCIGMPIAWGAHKYYFSRLQQQAPV